MGCAGKSACLLCPVFHVNIEGTEAERGERRECHRHHSEASGFHFSTLESDKHEEGGWGARERGGEQDGVQERGRSDRKCHRLVNRKRG